MDGAAPEAKECTNFAGPESTFELGTSMHPPNKGKLSLLITPTRAIKSGLSSQQELATSDLKEFCFRGH